MQGEDVQIIVVEVNPS